VAGHYEKKDAPYSAVPDTNNGYNSNSFLSGLILKMGITPPPRVQKRSYYGWDKPLPAEHFDKK